MDLIKYLTRSALSTVGCKFGVDRVLVMTARIGFPLCVALEFRRWRLTGGRIFVSVFVSFSRERNAKFFSYKRRLQCGHFVKLDVSSDSIDKTVVFWMPIISVQSSSGKISPDSLETVGVALDEFVGAVVTLLSLTILIMYRPENDQNWTPEMTTNANTSTPKNRSHRQRRTVCCCCLGRRDKFKVDSFGHIIIYGRSFLHKFMTNNWTTKAATWTVQNWKPCTRGFWESKAAELVNFFKEASTRLFWHYSVSLFNPFCPCRGGKQSMAPRRQVRLVAIPRAPSLHTGFNLACLYSRNHIGFGVQVKIRGITTNANKWLWILPVASESYCDESLLLRLRLQLYFYVDTYRGTMPRKMPRTCISSQYVISHGLRNKAAVTTTILGTRYQSQRLGHESIALDYLVQPANHVFTVITIWQEPLLQD